MIRFLLYAIDMPVKLLSFKPPTFGVLNSNLGVYKYSHDILQLNTDKLHTTEKQKFYFNDKWTFLQVEFALMHIFS